MRATRRSAGVGSPKRYAPLCHRLHGYPAPVNAPRHSLLDDVMGIVTGTLVCALGIYFLRVGHVVTGGTAGLALLFTYKSSLPLGVWYAGINLPFVLLGLRKKGLNFTIRSVVSVSLVVGFAQLAQTYLQLQNLDAWFAAVVGNLLAGVGLLILFRHNASLGGVNVIALLAQERLGWRAGYVQMALDAVVVTVSAAELGATGFVISAVGVVVVNLTLAQNHRPGRYLGY